MLLPTPNGFSLSRAREAIPLVTLSSADEAPNHPVIYYESLHNGAICI